MAAYSMASRRSGPSAGLVTGHEDRSVALRPDLDRLDDRAAAMTDRRSGRRPRLAAGCLIRGAPLDHVLGVHDRDRPPDELGQCLGDLTEAAAGQGDARESVVDGSGSLEARGLDVEDHGQDGIDDLVERRFWRELDEREGVLIGRFDHRRRYRLDVSAGLEGDAGQAALGQPWDERVERDRVVA